MRPLFIVFIESWKAPTCVQNSIGKISAVLNHLTRFNKCNILHSTYVTKLHGNLDLTWTHAGWNETLQNVICVWWVLWQLHQFPQTHENPWNRARRREIPQTDPEPLGQKTEPTGRVLPERKRISRRDGSDVSVIS